MEKDRLFAEINLDHDELQLYENVYNHLAIDAPKPDLVIYLQAPVPVLLDRIQNRGIAAEQQIDKTYLAQLVDAYTRFFHYYDAAPLLIVNAAEIDLVNNNIEGCFPQTFKCVCTISGDKGKEGEIIKFVKSDDSVTES